MEIKSKGDIWAFIQDAASDSKLQKKMQQVVKTRGKGMNAEGLHEEFRKLRYLGVSVDDCSKILYGLKHGGDDWVY